MSNNSDKKVKSSDISHDENQINFSEKLESNDESLWYYVDKNKQVGPLVFSELKQKLNSGNLNSNTLIWSKSLVDWTPALEVDDFKLRDRPIPPPLPKLRKKSKIFSPKTIIISSLVIILVLSATYSLSKGLSINNQFLSVLSRIQGKSKNMSHRNKLSVKEISNYSKSVVMLNIYDGNHTLIKTGSGFVASPDGKLITNFHVIDEGVYIEAVTDDDVKYSITGVLDYNVEKDIAVLQLDNSSTITNVSLGDSSIINTGDEIVAIGSPQGLKNTISNGIISGIRKEDGNDIIQLTAPISPGSSGGALFNIYGEVVGITFAGIEEGQNLNFAIPINEVKTLLNSNQVNNLKEVMSKVNGVGNTCGNTINGGLASIDEEWIYYVSNEDGDKLYKQNIRSGEKIKLTDSRAEYINIVGEWIYFANSFDYHRLYKIKTDGTNQTKLSDETYVREIYVLGDTIYFTSIGERFNKINTDGTKEKTLFTDSQVFHDTNVIKDWVYYGNEDGIFRTNLNGKEKTKIVDCEYPYSINVSNGWIYYTGTNKELYKVGINGGSRFKISNDRVYSLNVVGEWIYYTNEGDNNSLYKMKVDGSNKIKISNKSIFQMNIVGNWLYCEEFDLTHNLRMPTEYPKDPTSKKFWISIK